MDWFFNGLGTLLIGTVIGAAGGGGIGYKIGVSTNKVTMKQKAGNNSSQNQTGTIQSYTKEK